MKVSLTSHVAVVTVLVLMVVAIERRRAMTGVIHLTRPVHVRFAEVIAPVTARLDTLADPLTLSDPLTVSEPVTVNAPLTVPPLNSKYLLSLLLRLSDEDAGKLELLKIG